MFMNRWWRCVRSASYSGWRYLSRFATTNEVSTIGIASTSERQDERRQRGRLDEAFDRERGEQEAEQERS